MLVQGRFTPIRLRKGTGIEGCYTEALYLRILLLRQENPDFLCGAQKSQNMLCGP